MGEKLKKNSISSYSFKKQKGNCTTFLIQHHTKKKLQQKRLWRFSIFQEFKMARLQNQQRWPLHWMSFYDDLSNASCSTARKNELLHRLYPPRNTIKKFVLSNRLDEFFFFIEGWKSISNSFCPVLVHPPTIFRTRRFVA